MSSFRSPDLLERRNNATTVQKAMLEKFRATRQDPAFEQRRLKRIAVNEARAARAAEREAAKKARKAELAAQAALAAELAAHAQREAEKAEAIADAKTAEMFDAVCKLGLEGIVSKKLNSTYRSGLSKSWIKVKNPRAAAATRVL